jgi:hypothetical protein
MLGTGCLAWVIPVSPVPTGPQSSVSAAAGVGAAIASAVFVLLAVYALGAWQPHRRAVPPIRALRV